MGADAPSQLELIFFPGEGFTFQNMGLDIPEGLFLPFVPEHFQQVVQFRLGIGVHTGALQAIAEICKGCAIGIMLPLVGHTGGPSVHDHFNQVFSGHMEGFIIPGFPADVRPIFIMMAVAALMVHPGFAVTLDLPLCGVGTAVALVVFCAVPKFHKGIFGQVVGQTLPIQTYPEAAAHYDQAVLGDGLEMLPNFHGFLQLAFYPLSQRLVSCR